MKIASMLVVMMVNVEIGFRIIEKVGHNTVE